MEPIDIGKKFRKDHTIRFRFLANIAGSLYVLNSSAVMGSPEPIFEGEESGLRGRLGLRTHVGANQVGIYPDPAKGGGLRFTGSGGRDERFLLAFVPDELDATRAMAAIAVGAEGWIFGDEETHTVLGTPGHILFHPFQLRSR